MTPRVPSALPQHQIVPLVARAQVVPDPGELMLSHLAGRFGIGVTAALAGAADNKTGRLPARSEIVARKVGISFLRNMFAFSGY